MELTAPIALPTACATAPNFSAFPSAFSNASAPASMPSVSAKVPVVSDPDIVVLPVVGLLEKTDPIPMSISEPVITGGAEPSLARKLNEKV